MVINFNVYKDKIEKEKTMNDMELYFCGQEVIKDLEAAEDYEFFAEMADEIQLNNPKNWGTFEAINTEGEEVEVLFARTEKGNIFNPNQLQKAFIEFEQYASNVSLNIAPGSSAREVFMAQSNALFKLGFKGRV